MDTVQHVFKGSFIHSTHQNAMEVLENYLLGTNSAGKILFFEEAQDQTRLAQKWKFDESKIDVLAKNEFFMPGMVDTHIHAPQYSFIGTGMERPLFEWLKHNAFPTEDMYANLEIANNVYNAIVKRTLKNGTTTACYFATIHTDASIVLADFANQYGQRAFIGKICMDSNAIYPQYKESTEESIKETKRFVEVLKKKKYDRVKPIVTPRFAVSCSEKLLNELGTFAEEHQLQIQSHISESLSEVEQVLNIFPGYKNYTDIYDRNKLLTDKTIMAHGCFLSNEELLVFREKGAAISHCPNSNISLCSGHLNVQNILKHKVKLGLGTDASGGYTTSILDVIRNAIDTSKIILMEEQKSQKEKNKIDASQDGKRATNQIDSNDKNNLMETEASHILSIKEAFRLATLGGSEALSIDHITGNFEVGKEFDALLIDPEAVDSPFEVFSAIPKEEMIQRFLYLGDDRNIKAVYVAGRRVVPFLTNA
ncbi:guanine deaminase [Mantella aurantiaca]